MRRLIVALFLIIVVIGAGLGFVVGRTEVREGLMSSLASSLDEPASANTKPVRFVVRPGESSATIANRLEEAGLIRSAWGFRLLARLRGVDNQLQAGEYDLKPSMKGSEVLTALRGQGRIAGGFTVIEGWRAAEIADAAAARDMAKRDEFLTLIREGSFAADFLSDRPAGASLEGYLFPDTYQFLPGTQPRAIIQTMLDNFGRRFSPELRARAAVRGLSVHQVVTMASIVEREAVKPEERALIAGVLFNRQRQNMRLQIDATVQYAILGPNPIAQSGGYWKGGLTRADLDVDSPYNTYRYAGLPPGPIANPGLASIQAVLEPAQTDYLYFVARPDGTHAFAATLEKHNENVELYSR